MNNSQVFGLSEAALRSIISDIDSSKKSLASTISDTSSNVSNTTADVWSGNARETIIKTFIAENNNYEEFAESLSSVTRLLDEAINTYKKAENTITDNITINETGSQIPKDKSSTVESGSSTAKVEPKDDEIDVEI